jgi:hypothetical protein
LKITVFKAIAKKNMHMQSVSYTHLAASERNNPPRTRASASSSGPSDMEQEPVSRYAEGSSIETDAERPVIDDVDESMEGDVAVQHHEDDDEMISLRSEPNHESMSMESDIEDDEEMISSPDEQEHLSNRMEQEPVSRYAEGSSIETDAERPVIDDDDDESMESDVAVQHHEDDDEMISLRSEPNHESMSMERDIEDDEEMISSPVEQEHLPNRVVRR